MRGLVVLAFLMVLGGCATGSEEKGAGQPLAPGVTLELPDAPVFGGGLDVVQLVQARYQDRHQMFQSFIQSDARHLGIVMTVPSGPRIMRIDWRQGAFDAKKEPIAPEALSPQRMLADIMLVYASSDDLRVALKGGMLVDGVDGTRSVMRDGRTIIVVTRPRGDVWQGRATLRNLAFDYALNIQSHRAAP